MIPNGMKGIVVMTTLASAQLITCFEPGARPAPQTSVDLALAAWCTLDEPARAEALLILFEEQCDRPRVLGRSAITALAADRRG